MELHQTKEMKTVGRRLRRLHVKFEKLQAAEEMARARLKREVERVMRLQHGQVFRRKDAVTLRSGFFLYMGPHRMDVTYDRFGKAFVRLYLYRCTKEGKQRSYMSTVFYSNRDSFDGLEPVNA